jgi:hypothetical protein
MTLSPCKEIAARMGDLFTCEQVSGFVRVRTPFLYPDGDVIDVFVREDSDSILVTDLGETLRWLRGQSVSDKRTARQRQLISDITLTHGVELSGGELRLHVNSPDALVSAITDISQACLRTADVWFTSRTRIASTAADEVAEFLESRELSFDRSPPLMGRSGKMRTVDFRVNAPRQTSLVQVLATGSRGATVTKAEHALAVWFDLSHLGDQATYAQQFISLFDDTVDVWSPEDISLLSAISKSSFLSEPDNFEKLLLAA